MWSFYVIKPELLGFNWTDESLASVKALHLLIGTSELWDIEKEIEREKKHCSHDPFNHEAGEHSILKEMVPRHLFDQHLVVIFPFHLVIIHFNLSMLSKSVKKDRNNKAGIFSLVVNPISIDKTIKFLNSKRRYIDFFYIE